MSQPAIFENMNAVECQSLIFSLEDEVEYLDAVIEASVQRGFELFADCLVVRRDKLTKQIKEAEMYRDSEGV